MTPTFKPLLRSIALGTVLGLSSGPALAAPVLESLSATVSAEPRTLADKSFQDLLAGKLAEAERPMTPERAARLVTQAEARTFYQELGYMGPAKLRDLARLEPGAVDRFGRVLAADQQAWLRDINQTLSSFHVQADGPVKSWYSMLGKLDRYTETNRQQGHLLADGSPVPSTPGDLNDLTRGRVNMPGLDPALLHRMLEHVQASLPEQRPLCVLNFVVKDYATEALLKDPKAPYKGRIHLVIQDVTGGVKHGAFELQLGPKHLSEFWDRHFKVPGSDQVLDLHDAVYKGVGAITRADHLERLGRALNPDPSLSQAEAVAAGRREIDEVIQEYQKQLHAALDQARAGTPELDYAATARLRELIGHVVLALKDAPDLPEGLQQRDVRHAEGPAFVGSGSKLR